MDGSMFGPYRIDALIGRGGMGEVHRAQDTRRHRTVALKRLPAQFASDPAFVARFQRESELAARLRSPHIVPIHDFGSISETLFIDMRLIDGRDLGRTLREEGALASERAVELIEQIAAALDDAHATGLIHRDVKPANVLVERSERTGAEFCYLIDFGIAQTVSGRGATSLTASGAAVGTVDYIAPERIQGMPSVDHRSGVYSLACVLYELLTGHRPFVGDSPMAVMYAHVHQPRPRPSQIRDELPPGLDDVIADGMASDPKERTGSAGQFAALARAALNSNSQTPTRRTRPVKRTSGDESRRLGRRAVIVGAGAVGLAALAGGTWAVVGRDQVAESVTLARMAARGRAVIGVRGDQPGLGLETPDGQFSGFDIDIARLVADGLGFAADRVELMALSTSDRESALIEGRVDFCVGTYTITPERKAQVSFAGPYLSCEQGILVRDDETAISGAGSLRGRRVCGVPNSLPLVRIRELGLSEAASIVEMSSYTQCVSLILAGSADALVTDDIILRGYVQSAPDRLRVVRDTYGFAPLADYGVGLSRDDSALRTAINDLLARAFDEGSWAASFAANFGRTGSTPAPPTLQRY